MVSKIMAGTYSEVKTEFFNEMSFTGTEQNKLVLLVYKLSVSYTISTHILNQWLSKFGLGILKVKTILIITPRHPLLFSFSLTRIQWGFPQT